MTIGQRIKEFRASKKISQKDLADAIGVSRGNVGDWESDKAKPGADALLTLSDYFEVSVDALLRGEGEQGGARILVQAMGSDISPQEAEYLAKFRQLNNENRIKVEGYTEGLLSSQGCNVSPQSRTGASSRSTNGYEREEAAARHESA